jgi:hypothetical protein
MKALAIAVICLAVSFFGFATAFVLHMFWYHRPPPSTQPKDTP